MRVIEISADGFGLENLRVAERPDPEPGPGQVVVAVSATSLNYRDLLMVEGAYNPRQKLPLIPLSDGVGRVEAVGPGVDRVKVGDRVAGAFAQGWLAGEPDRRKLATTLGGPLDGMLAEKVCLSAEGVVPVPAHLGDAEAATLPCAYVTAWSALRLADATAGDTVLVQGTGGVSIAALQLAKCLGMRAIVTSSSDAKLERARALGADETINYRENPEWGKAARDLTAPRGVDVVVEVGGAGTLGQTLRCVRPGGTVAVIGILSGNQTKTLLTPILMQQIRMQGVIVGPRERFEELARAVSLHALRPVVDATFPMNEARAALEHMKAGRHFGKIVVEVPG